jgi:3-isopropylmalate/(R)-2-methylmalate dehydratase small subunit
MNDFAWVRRGTCRKFGDDIEHDGPIMPFKFAKERTLDPELLRPHLMVGVDPSFPDRVRPGDILVAGRNFGKGKAHFGGYIAMRSLGLGVLCESMPFLCYRAAVSVGLLVAAECHGIGAHAADGDELEVDFVAGALLNHTTGVTAAFPPVPEGLRSTIRLGGTTGLLKEWWEATGRTRPASGASA